MRCKPNARNSIGKLFLPMKRAVAVWVGVFLAGCGVPLAAPPDRLFYLSLEVNGNKVAPAFIDTGGEFEVLLSDHHDLEVIGELNVLAFGGQERVLLTEGFPYRVGDIELQSDGAIVGLSVCKCNGLGLSFIQKADRIIHLNFDTGEAELVDELPAGALSLDFADPPARLATFRGAFMDMEVTANGTTRLVKAVLDTGATRTVMSRSLFGGGSALSPNMLPIRISHVRLGEIGLNAGIFENDALPDMILGTDVMEVWGPEWYLDFRTRSRGLHVFPTGWEGPPPPLGEGGQTTH